MASLVLNGGQEEFSWRITGLSSAFGNNNGYVQAGITRYQFTQASSSVDGIVDTITAPSIGTSTSTNLKTISYSPGNYQFWGFTRVLDGTYYPAGSSTVTVEGITTERPNDWYWSSIITTGSPINISASDFNSFLSRINDFRVYVGLPQYGAFQYAQSGNVITSSIVAHPVYAIRAMNPPIQEPNVPSVGTTITASFFNQLASSLNSIP